jgi:hypothetical protein
MSIVSETSIEIVCFADGRMDTGNAAKYTGLKKKTMAMARSEGTGPKFIKRGRIFYFKEDLDTWMNANGRHSSTAQARHAQKENEPVAA